MLTKFGDILRKRVPCQVSVSQVSSVVGLVSPSFAPKYAQIHIREAESVPQFNLGFEGQDALLAAAAPRFRA